MTKVLVPLSDNDVAPRFDQASEVWIGWASPNRPPQGKTLVLTHPSAEDLCQMALTEKAQVVICGAIENEFYEYLVWKKIQVIDFVLSPYERALKALVQEELRAGDNLYTNKERGR
jgi:hypothetical protein